MLALVGASVFVGFVILAIACISFFGLFGIVVWLLCYGLFHILANRLRAFVGDEYELFTAERRAEPVRHPVRRSSRRR
jgi:hypothetical protein